MTITMVLPTILNAIAGLSLSSADILDVDEIPETAENIRKPVIYPNPDGLISDFVYTRDSYGAATSAKTSMEYTINYRLCHTPAAAGRGLYEIYPDVIAVLVDFIETVTENCTAGGAVDVQFAGVTRFGIVLDPADRPFEGCDFSVRVLEFIN